MFEEAIGGGGIWDWWRGYLGLVEGVFGSNWWRGYLGIVEGVFGTCPRILGKIPLHFFALSGIIYKIGRGYLRYE